MERPASAKSYDELVEEFEDCTLVDFPFRESEESLAAWKNRCFVWHNSFIISFSNGDRELELLLRESFDRMLDRMARDDESNRVLFSQIGLGEDPLPVDVGVSLPLGGVPARLSDGSRRSWGLRIIAICTLTAAAALHQCTECDEGAGEQEVTGAGRISIEQP